MVRSFIYCLAVFLLGQFAWVNNLASEPRLYQYQQTEQVVGHVELAAREFANEGLSAFASHDKRDGHWGYNDRTLFIFDMEGRLVFHPGKPELVGIKLFDYVDVDGKPFFRHMVEVVDESERGAGWVHYRGYRHNQVFPVLKTAYVMKAHNRAGETYIIGSELDPPRLEKQFVKDVVDSAARMMESKGLSALSDLNQKSGRFVFGDVMMMFLKMDGALILDPSIPFGDQNSDATKRNLMTFRDATGNAVFRDAIERLKETDSLWVSYMCPKPGEIRPSKKTLYMRKLEINGIPYIIGSGIFLSRPVWMK